jgi:hypothetical protein
MKTSLLVSSLFLSAFSNAASIVNGGFESPVLPVNVLAIAGGSSTLTGWSVTGSDVLLIKNTHTEFGPLVFNSQEGLHCVDLTGDGNTGLNNGIFQDVATTIGQDYVLTFWVGRANGVASDASYQTESTIFLGINSSLVGTYTNSETGPVGTLNWKKFSRTFTATATSTNIGFFNGTNTVALGGNNFAGLDNVSIEAVPEPTTITGLVAACALLRRKKLNAS